MSVLYPTQMDAKRLHDDVLVLNGEAELLDRVGPLWSQVRRHHADLAPRWSADLLATSFERRRAELVRKGGILVSLATAQAQDIGYCVSTITPDAMGEVDSLYLIPSRRGTGIGHALMSRAMDWFAAQSVQSIVVNVISGNDAAQQFYARYGFLPRTVRLHRPGGGVG